MSQQQIRENYNTFQGRHQFTYHHAPQPPHLMLLTHLFKWKMTCHSLLIFTYSREVVEGGVSHSGESLLSTSVNISCVNAQPRLCKLVCKQRGIMPIYRGYELTLNLSSVHTVRTGSGS